jgi:hypothetical protein
MTNPFAFGNASAPAPAATAPAQPPATTTPQQQPAPAPAAAPAAPPAGDDPFSAPAPQLARGPRLREMYGRLLLVLPHKVETVPNKLSPVAGATQERMTADVIVLDGGQIQYGGKPEAVPPVPHDKTANVPHKTDRMFISAVGLISQCREALARRMAGQPGMVLGRLARGEAKGNQEAPYLLTPPTDQDKQVARQYLAQVDPFA